MEECSFRVSSLVSRAARLLTQTQCLDDSTIAIDIAALQIVEETATLTYETSQSTLCAVVLTVLLHVLCQMSNTIGEESYLALCASCVLTALTILGENLYLLG